ncbi:MAG: endonuclease III domain-containing protein [Desulfovibrio sp.]|nr:MAG: endonuclease III domain-containing protein [Desulfovibrio sp.]
MYEAMLRELGPSGWWPAESPLEVAVGAVLTQNTNWRNVSRAIDNLREAGMLDGAKLMALAPEDLAELIRPAGYYRLKAGRLRNLLAFLDRECQFDFSRLKEQEMEELREGLLSVRGVGPETADSILLYALDMPSFVVDAYTKRILNRHNLVTEDVEYHEMRELFMDILDPDPQVYNEYHALLVRTGHAWCKKRQQQCDSCPLRDFL